MAHLLIVDDEESICWGLTRLAKEMGHRASSAASAEEGLELARTDRPDVVVLDVRLPGMDGLTALGHFRKELSTAPIIIVITAYGELETAVEAVRKGAFEYLVKPFDLSIAQRAIERALLAQRNQNDTQPIKRPSMLSGQMVGRSAAMQQVFKQIALVARTEACVHLYGESGTGKELVARAIHRYSRRAEGPFVPVNLASLSPTLAESELFGHVRGAFTGAEGPRKGLMQQAHGGTIFLDELADVPLMLQVKLLRALEHGEIWPVGAERPTRSDFRVISATHQNLQERVVRGTFRHDLYFRLITFQIDIPPLRDRREDIAALCQHFLDQLSGKNQTQRPNLSGEGLAELERRSWFGNVRELRNVIEHAMIVARGEVITAGHFPPPASAPASCSSEQTVAALIGQWAESQLHDAEGAGDLHDRFLQLVEPPLLEAALRKYRGQCAAAARRLGMHRSTLRKKLDQFDIDGLS